MCFPTFAGFSGACSRRRRQRPRARDSAGLPTGTSTSGAAPIPTLHPLRHPPIWTRRPWPTRCGGSREGLPRHTMPELPHIQDRPATSTSTSGTLLPPCRGRCDVLHIGQGFNRSRARRRAHRHLIIWHQVSALAAQDLLWGARSTRTRTSRWRGRRRASVGFPSTSIAATVTTTTLARSRLRRQDQRHLSASIPACYVTDPFH